MEVRQEGLALYPGSFDPFTFGHLDILERASRLFDQIVVTIAKNSSKTALFSPSERLELVKGSISHLDNVRVEMFDGLLVKFAEQKGAIALVRGLRQVSDFDYEFRMAFANRRLAPKVETVFLMTSEHHALISASIVREIHSHGGDTSTFVTKLVQQALNNK